MEKEDFLTSTVHLGNMYPYSKDYLLYVWRGHVDAFRVKEDDKYNAFFSDVSNEDARNKLHEGLNEVEKVLNGEHHYGSVLGIECHCCDAVSFIAQAGGMSSGEDPSELYSHFSRLELCAIFDLNVVEQIAVAHRTKQKMAGDKVVEDDD